MRQKYYHGRAKIKNIRNDKIKICFISLAAYPLFNRNYIKKVQFGGTEVQTYLISKNLPRKYFSISVVVGDFGQKDEEYYNGIKLFKLKGHSKNRLGKYLKYIRIFSLLKKINADIYQQSAAGPMIGIIALFAKIYNKKYIYRTAHDIDCNKEYLRQNSYLSRLLFWYGLHNANIICENIKHIFLLKKNHNLFSRLIPSPLDVNQSSNKQMRKYILWVGRLVDWKQPEVFLDIAKKMPFLNFIMVCSGETDFAKKIYMRAKMLNNIHIQKNVQFEKLSKYYMQAICLVHTSKYEGYPPNTIIQAWLTKTPVIHLNLEQFEKRYILKNKLGLHAKNIDEIIEYINLLTNNKKIVRKIQSSSYKYALENHGLKNVIQKYIQYYCQDIMNSS